MAEGQCCSHGCAPCFSFIVASLIIGNVSCLKQHKLFQFWKTEVLQKIPRTYILWTKINMVAEVVPSEGTWGESPLASSSSEADCIPRSVATWLLSGLPLSHCFLLESSVPLYLSLLRILMTMLDNPGKPYNS